MKEYKLMSTREVEDKAVILGYEPSRINREGSFLFLHMNGNVFDSTTWLKDSDEFSKYTSEVDYFDQSPFEYITVADFLDLPEPFKVGDWVKFTNCDGTVIFKIGSLSDSSCLPDKIIMGNFEPKLIGFCFTGCTKLTQKQIDTLEL
jgi:hypothetical protein